MSDFAVNTGQKLIDSRTSQIPASPNFIFKFDFEDRFPVKSAERWMRGNYHHCLYYTTLYLVVVYSLKWFMSKRQPRDLRLVQFAWNILLAILSFCAAIRILQESFYVLYNFGLRYSLCNPSYLTETPATSFWTYFTCAIRVLEFGDTLFLVLRKKRLIFLHWFHHSSAVIIFWVAVRDSTACLRWSMAANLTIHVLMYTYYAVRSLKLKVPPVFALLITTVQTLQMLVGSMVCLLLFVWTKDGKGCALSNRTGILGILIYLLFLVLFLDYFKVTYWNSNQRSKKAQ